MDIRSSLKIFRLSDKIESRVKQKRQRRLNTLMNREGELLFFG